MPKSKKPRKKQHYTKVALPTVPQSMIDNVKDHIRLIGFAVEVKLPLGRFDVNDVHELNEFINWTGYTAYKLQHDRSRWTREQADEVISTQIQVSEALKSLYQRTNKIWDKKSDDEWDSRTFTPTGDELKIFSNSMALLYPFMSELYEDSPKLLTRFWAEAKGIMRSPQKKVEGLLVRTY